jgi:hypothetical protein
MKKVSIVMSGSRWTRRMNARTLWPVSSSIISVKRSAMTRWNSSRIAITCSGSPLSIIVCSSAAHRDHLLGFAAVDHRLLERGETAAAQDDDDHVVQRVGLGVDRAAAVVLAQHPDDAVGDGRQELPSPERGWRVVGWRPLHLVRSPVRRGSRNLVCGSVAESDVACRVVNLDTPLPADRA